MIIELKNISYNASLSEETACYSATLHVDGVKIGQVSNRGHGGDDEFSGDAEAYAKANAWVKANIPPLESEFGLDPLPMDIDLYCGRLLDAHLLLKDLRAMLRSRVVFVKAGEQDLLEMKFKGVRKIEDLHIAQVRKKYPDATILNDMSEDDALAFYRKHG